MNTAGHHLTGLTDAQVLESREKYGRNVLTPPARDPLWKQYLEKFRDPLIIVLLVAGMLSVVISLYGYFGLGHGASAFFEPVGIFVAILLATGLSFLFEVKANREFSILNQVNDDEPVQVIRNGNAHEIPRKDVVVGDIVIFSTGEEIPADAELIEAVTLTVDESTLTGEPLCAKTVDPEHFDPDATFPSNHVMRGTRVMEGHGICRVLAVGDSTENGRVFVAAQIDGSVRTPLTEQFERLGTLITRGSYGFGIMVIVGRVAMFLVNMDHFVVMDFVTHFLQSIMIGVTLIVVSVPEGLPMAVTLSLAYSMRRMLQTNNLVRKLHACETMGAATVICTDKTGTLTKNQMQVHEADFYGFEAGATLALEGRGLLVAESMACNSTAQLDLENPERPEVLGNPTEGALLLWLRAHGVDYRDVRERAVVVEELPFSTMRKCMAVIVRSASGRRMLYVKGAPEIVHALCRSCWNNVEAAAVEAELSRFQDQAMRTLGFACQELGEGDRTFEEGRVVAERLAFMGVVAIADPVRPDVPAAVKECLDAGVQVKIVTGDTPGTAREIAREIGLWSGQPDEKAMITGPEFAALSDEKLASRVRDLRIIARARPMDKERLVRILQAQNEVVAVTGDGTNDAPALNTAHVGLSMGDGTSVAKEASDITIVDNSFASIGRAIMWGRSLYLNIQRFILFQMTVNVAACFTVLVGAFMGAESPLTVTQMLWVNLIMDTFAAVALSSLPPSSSVMKAKPRRRDAFIMDGPITRAVVLMGGILSALLIGLVWVFEHGDFTSVLQLFSCSPAARDGLSPYEQSLFFTIFVFFQFWNMFNAKAFSTKRSAFHFRGCGNFLLIAFIIFVGQIVIITVGGQLFNVVPISLEDWVAIIVLTSPVLLVGELVRLVRR